MRKLVSIFLYSILRRFHVQSSPHYYLGDSFAKLLIYRTLRLISYLADFSFSKESLSTLKCLKNSKIGKSAILCGTGKSLDKLTQKFIDDNLLDIWAVNDYYKTRIGKKVKPNYYCFSDPVDLDKIATLDSAAEIISYLVLSKSTIVLPDSAADNSYVGIKSIYYNDRQHFRTKGKLNPLRPRKFSSITLYKALNVMQFLGYETIYIIGLDGSEFHGYVGNIKNELLIDTSRTHATGIDNGKVQLSVLVSGIAGRMQSYSRLFGDLRLFDSSRIVNLSPGSLVDTFTKKEIS